MNYLTRHRFSVRPRASGFTLIELICAVAVMVLVLMILLQTTDSVLAVSRTSRQQMDASRNGRGVMDIMSGDFNNLVTDFGLSVLVKSDAAQNTQLTFLTRNRGPSSSGSNCRYVAVSYQLSASGQVIRSYCPVQWDDRTPMLTAAQLPTNATSTSVVAEGILKLQAVAVLDSGTSAQVAPLSSTLSSQAWASANFGGQALSNSNYQLLLTTPPSADFATATAATPRVRALTVGLAALDTQTYRLPNAPSIATGLGSVTASTTITDQTSLTGTPYGVWSQKMLSGALGTYPKPAVASLRMMQTTFHLK